MIVYEYKNNNFNKFGTIATQLFKLCKLFWACCNIINQEQCCDICAYQCCARYFLKVS